MRDGFLFLRSIFDTASFDEVQERLVRTCVFFLFSARIAWNSGHQDRACLLHLHGAQRCMAGTWTCGDTCHGVAFAFTERT